MHSCSEGSRDRQGRAGIWGQGGWEAEAPPRLAEADLSPHYPSLSPPGERAGGIQTSKLPFPCSGDGGRRQLMLNIRRFCQGQRGIQSPLLQELTTRQPPCDLHPDNPGLPSKPRVSSRAATQLLPDRPWRSSRPFLGWLQD